jgi:hypothetical protein
MEINFTNQELILVYGHFKKKINELEKIKSTPNCPFPKKDIDKDISLYTSITDKLKSANPNLGNMDDYRF